MSDRTFKRRVADCGSGGCREEYLTNAEITEHEDRAAKAVIERQQERWAQVRRNAVKRISDCDCVVLKSLERGESVPQDWRDYRDALRAIADQEDGDPDAVAWPEAPAGS